MPEKIPEELLQRLDALAAKLGATGSMLWEAMVRWTVGNAITNAFIALVFLLVPLAMLIVTYRWHPTAPEGSMCESCKDDIPMCESCARLIAFWIGIALAGLICAIGIGTSLPALLSPEGQAIRDLMGR
jgi:hypothetical protein